MTTENKQERTANDEIDLIYFFRPIGRFLNNMGNGLYKWFKSIKKNIAIVLLIIILSVAAGYSLRYVLTQLYKTDGIFLSKELTAGICVNIIEDLNSNVGEPENLPVIAQKLNITEKEASSIRGVYLKNLSDTLKLKNEDSLATTIKITLLVDNITLIDKVQKGIVNLFENNEYALKKKQSRLENLIDLKNNLDKKINSLDTLKEIVNKSIIPKSNGQGSVFLGEPINPVSVYERETNYFREQLFLNDKIKNINTFEIIRPFSKIYKPNSPNFFEIFLYSLGLGFLFGIIFGPIIGNRLRKNRNT